MGESLRDRQDCANAVVEIVCRAVKVLCDEPSGAGQRVGSAVEIRLRLEPEGFPGNTRNDFRWVMRAFTPAPSTRMHAQRLAECPHFGALTDSARAKPQRAAPDRGRKRSARPWGRWKCRALERNRARIVDAIGRNVTRCAVSVACVAGQSVANWLARSTRIAHSGAHAHHLHHPHHRPRPL